jgi:hypothetical protein
MHPLWVISFVEPSMETSFLSSTLSMFFSQVSPSFLPSVPGIEPSVLGKCFTTELQPRSCPCFSDLGPEGKWISLYY